MSSIGFITMIGLIWAIIHDPLMNSFCHTPRVWIADRESSTTPNFYGANKKKKQNASIPRQRLTHRIPRCTRLRNDFIDRIGYGTIKRRYASTRERRFASKHQDKARRL